MYNWQFNFKNIKCKLHLNKRWHKNWNLTIVECKGFRFHFSSRPSPRGTSYSKKYSVRWGWAVRLSREIKILKHTGLYVGWMGAYPSMTYMWPLCFSSFQTTGSFLGIKPVNGPTLDSTTLIKIVGAHPWYLAQLISRQWSWPIIAPNQAS